jgi:GMP synthase (glutamine-hydrolysing)
MDTILILDFGSQSTQLIARRIRQIGVYSTIVSGDTPVSRMDLESVKGLILSGSPESVYEKGAPKPDPRIYHLGLPLLGICYGFQRICQDQGGRVESMGRKEYGRTAIRIGERIPIFARVSDGFLSWMSHGDAVTRLPEGFQVVASSENGLPAAFRKDHIYGLQFHPEVSHCEFGLEILEDFAVGVCGARREWNMDAFLRGMREEIVRRVGDRDVVLLISGGVDSSVVAALLLESLDPNKVYLLYVDTGLMRGGETKEILENLKSFGAVHLHTVDAAERFYAALSGVSDPERKREIIGDLFIQVQEKEIAAIGVRSYLLAQGTLYPDLIESGRGVGTKAHVIKTHHNVRSPLVDGLRERGLILEPLSSLYKDEVRTLGLKLGLARHIVFRHPFPGPGLAVRILGEVTREACDLLRKADGIFIEELRDRGFYDAIWQAFCVLLPVRSVGVSGDMRRYGYVLALRAVASADAISADVFPFPMDALLAISSRITNRIPEIGRVVYDISSKPPATIEWE